MNMILKEVNINGKIKDIRISGDKIYAVAGHIESSGEAEINCRGCIAIPGFIDAHLHLDKCLLNERSPYVDLTGPEKGALTRCQKEHFTVSDIEYRAERVIQHGISRGNIAVRTNVDVDPIVGLKGIEALLGLREKYKGFVDIQVTAFAQEGFSKYPETKMLLDEALKMGADLVGGHTIVDQDGEAHINIILDLAEKYGVEAEFHLDESGRREHYLLPYLAQQMITRGLEGRVAGIHCCTLSALNDDDLKQALEWIQRSALKVTIAPTAISTRALAPVKGLMGAGVKLALGSDNVRDFFNPLGSGDIKQAALLLAYVHRMFLKEEVDALLSMITCGGAELIGYKDYGIHEGSRADIVVLDAKGPHEILADQPAAKVLVRGGKVIETDH